MKEPLLFARFRRAAMVVVCLAATFPASAADEVRCCDTASGEWVGELPIAECLALEGHVPEDAAHVEEAGACSDGGEGGGAGDGFESNLPNGGFEQWAGAKPIGFATFSTPAGSQIEIETVFRSSDAHTGEYSALIRNMKMDIPGMPAGLSVPGMPDGVVMPGGLVTCKKNCPVNTGRSLGKRGLDSTTFPITESKDYLCGHYKSALVGSDKALVSLIVRRGKQAVGGTDSGVTGDAYIRKTATEWTPFKIPILRLPGQEDAVPDNGILEIMILPGGWSPSSAAPTTVGVNAGSQFQVDSLHLCGPELDLQIANGRATGQGTVPESRESTIGAQTFVNLDNDDRDAKFDFEDDEVKGDDELVLLWLKLPGDAEGEAVLRRLGAGPAVKVWTTPDKGQLFGELGQWLAVPGAFEKDPVDGSLRKLLYVEALEASTVQRDVRFELAFKDKLRPDDELTDDVALTVIGLESIVWRGDGNGRDHGDALDEDVNFFQAGASRVFPERHVRGGTPDGEARDTVFAEVTLSVAPVEEIALYFSSWDVDDPLHAGDPVDPETEAEDNRGITVPARGQLEGSAAGLLRQTFKERTQRLKFQVTRQPGDNFRIAGFGDEDFVRVLENDDVQLSVGLLTQQDNQQRIVDPAVLAGVLAPEHAELRWPKQYASPTLTVWRFLHVEADRMDTIRNNTVRGTVLAASPELLALGATTTLTLDKNFLALNRTARGTQGLADMFADGEIEVVGYGTFEVRGNSALGSGNDWVSVRGSVPASAAGAFFTLRDDDRSQGFVDGGEVPPVNLERVAKTFERAYIVPLASDLPNPTPVAPYVKNSYSDHGFHLRQAYAFDNAQFDRSEDIWAVYVLAAHQGVTTEDGDGEEARCSGEVDRINGSGAHIYLGGHRDLHGSAATTAQGKGEADAVAHEIGHLFGVEHGDGQLIDQLGDHFSEKALDKIRRARHP